MLILVKLLKENRVNNLHTTTCPAIVGRIDRPVARDPVVASVKDVFGEHKRHSLHVALHEERVT